MRSPRATTLEEGATAARARAAVADVALRELAQDALPEGAALLAVGGYGRGELSPHSDLDLLILVERRDAVSKDELRRLLYPLWDASLQVGHAVRTPKEAIERAGSDLHTATSLLSARLLAGTTELYDELLDRQFRFLRKHARRLTRSILAAAHDRHRRADRAGWALAPDLKDDIGGLRDHHTVLWLVVVARGSGENGSMERAAGSLLAAREALHAEIKRKSDRIRMDLQPRVAARLGFEGPGGADDLMAAVHSAARTIEHEGILARNALAEAVLGGPKRSGTVARVDDCVRIEDGVLHLSGERPDLPCVIRLAGARARTVHPIDRRSIVAAGKATDATAPERWDDRVRTAFLELLRAPRASAGLELLDHLGAWEALLPEWRPARGRAQHDPYHRYTVDGHSFLAVEEVTRAIAEDTIASGAALEAGELDALYVAALLHDVGKGSGEDHSVAGERIARAASARMGLGVADADDVAALVRRHLLLADTATRRDLDDGAVVESVAKTIGDDRRLRMLYILTVADGRATGPEGWTAWKEALVRELYRKTLHALETGEVPPRSDVAAKAREVEAYEPMLGGRAERVLQTLPPSYLVSVPVEDMAEEVRMLLRPPAPGEVTCRVEPGTEGGRSVVTIALPDRPGALARTAGVFALNRISVLRAQAYSTSDGVALQRFIAEAPEEQQWESFERDLVAAYSGQLALEARLERKAREYKPARSATADVRVLQDASDHSTVIEVRAHDALGLLYAVTAGLSDLDLDIHVAKIDTLGERVVDVFYVRTARKEKLSDEQGAEVERAIVHRLERVLGSP